MSYVCCHYVCCKHLLVVFRILFCRMTQRLRCCVQLGSLSCLMFCFSVIVGKRFLTFLVLPVHFFGLFWVSRFCSSLFISCFHVSCFFLSLIYFSWCSRQRFYFLLMFDIWFRLCADLTLTSSARENSSLLRLIRSVLAAACLQLVLVVVCLLRSPNSGSGGCLSCMSSSRYSVAWRIPSSLPSTYY